MTQRKPRGAYLGEKPKYLQEIDSLKPLAGDPDALAAGINKLKGLEKYPASMVTVEDGVLQIKKGVFSRYAGFYSALVKELNIPLAISERTKLGRPLFFIVPSEGTQGIPRAGLKETVNPKHQAHSLTPAAAATALSSPGSESSVQENVPVYIDNLFREVAQGKGNIRTEFVRSAKGNEVAVSTDPEALSSLEEIAVIINIKVTEANVNVFSKAVKTSLQRVLQNLGPTIVRFDGHHEVVVAAPHHMPNYNHYEGLDF